MNSTSEPACSRSVAAATVLWIGPDQSDAAGSIRDRLIGVAGAVIVRNDWRDVRERPVGDSRLGVPIDLAIVSRTRGFDGLDRSDLRRNQPAAEHLEIRGRGVAPVMRLPGHNDWMASIDAASAWWTLRGRLADPPPGRSPKSIAVVSASADFAETWLDWFGLEFPDSVLGWRRPGQRSFGDPAVCLWDGTAGSISPGVGSTRHAIIRQPGGGDVAGIEATLDAPADAVAVIRWVAAAQ